MTVVIAFISTSWSPSIPWRQPASALVPSSRLCPYCLCELRLIMAWAESQRSNAFKGLPHSRSITFFSDSALCWYNCSLKECARCLQRGLFFFRKEEGLSCVMWDFHCVSLCCDAQIQRRTTACSPYRTDIEIAFQAATCWGNISSKGWINLQL